MERVFRDCRFRTDFPVVSGLRLCRDCPRRTDFPVVPRLRRRASRDCRFRTDFPVVPRLGRKAAAVLEGFGVGLREGERPLHVLTQPPHRHPSRPGHPGLDKPPQWIGAHQRRQDARLQPRQRSTPVGAGEGLALDGRAPDAGGPGHVPGPSRGVRERRLHGSCTPAPGAPSAPRPGRVEVRCGPRDAAPSRGRGGSAGRGRRRRRPRAHRGGVRDRPAQTREDILAAIDGQGAALARLGTSWHRSPGSGSAVRQRRLT